MSRARPRRVRSCGETLLRMSGKALGFAAPVAMGLRVVQSLFGLAIAWVLADCVTRVVFDHAVLADIRVDMGGLAALFLLRSIVAHRADLLSVRAGAALRRHLFYRLLDHAQRLGPLRLAAASPGETASLLIEGVNGTEAYWRGWMPALAQVSVLPLAVLLIAFPMDWLSGLILFVTLPLLPLFMVLAGQAAERASNRQWDSLLRMGGHLLDRLRGLTDIKGLRAELRTIAEISTITETYRRDTMAVLRVAFLSALVLEFFATVSIAVMAVVIGFRLMWGDLDFHTGFFLLLLAPEFYSPLRIMGTQRHARMESTAAAERLVAFLNQPAVPLAVPSPAVSFPKTSSPETPSPKTESAPVSSVSVAFDAVSVTYDGTRNALDEVTFRLQAGHRMALVGESGSGKSTIFSLLCGFVAASHGQILINGTPLRDAASPAWRQSVSFLSQRPHLFPVSIARNVTMEVDDLSVSGHPAERDGAQDARLWAALEAAHADTFVRRLPQGAETILEENGRGLSGGEAQRLMLARAFYAPTPLILCDEPTAHLDPATEQDLTKSLRRLARGRTMITIAHRLQTIEHVDCIVVLHAGRVVDQGSHQDLLTRSGPYQRLTAAAQGLSPVEVWP